MLEISGHLEQFFNDFFSITYYLAHFKEFIIIIFYKQKNNKDFTSSKSYLPINLLNIIRKIMEVVLTAKISYITRTHNFLSKTHIGNQCGSCIEIAIHHLLKKIYVARNENKIVSHFRINVSATYSNTFHQCLLHNLGKKKIDVKIVD